MMKFVPFGKDDYAQLISWIPDAPFLLQWAGPQFSFPLDDAQLDRYVNGKDQPALDRLVYKVIEEYDVIGHISLGAIDWEHHSARIGKVLVGDKEARGQGSGSRMIKKMCGIAFDDMGLHRVSLGVWDFNQAAVRCYEKAGFIHEGRKRDIIKFGEEFWSMYEMSMLEEEWKERKKARL